MRKTNGNNRGETLIETIVAFSVALVMLTMLAAVMQGAGRINGFAAQRAAILEQDCTRVEQNAGVYGTDAGSDTLTLTPTDPLVPEEISIPLDVRSGEILHYFRSTPAGGGA